MVVSRGRNPSAAEIVSQLFQAKTLRDRVLTTLGLVPTAMAYVMIYGATPRMETAAIAVLTFVYPAAAVLVDAVGRLQEGALNHADSAAQDSFEDGLLDCPHYTRSEAAGTEGVPAVLLSGDHAAIARWRRQQSLGRTWLRRPDLLGRAVLDKADRALLAEFIAGWRAENPAGG